MKFTEAIATNQLAEVYHSSGDIHCFEYVMNHDWRRGECGQMYGPGIYTCWSFDSAFYDKNSHGSRNGTSKRYYLEKDIQAHRALTDELGRPVLFRFAFLVDVKDYFFFDYKQYKIVHPESNATKETYLDEQNERFGTHYVHAHNFCGYDYKKVVPPEGKPRIRGIVFVGGNDGDVVIVYDTDAAIPTRFSKGSVDEWFNVDNGDLSYAEKAKIALGLKDPKDYWANFESSDALNAYQDLLTKLNNLGADANKIKFLDSSGKVYSVEESLEEEITPDVDSIKEIELKNCDDLVCLDLSKLTDVSSLDIENEYDPELSSIVGIPTKNLSKFVINKAPKFVLDGMPVFEGAGAADSLFKLRQAKLTDGFEAKGFQDFKLIGLEGNHLQLNGIGVGTALVKNVNADAVTIENVGEINIKSSSLKLLSIPSTNGINTLNIIDGSDIEEINIGGKTYSMDNVEDVEEITVTIG